MATLAFKLGTLVVKQLAKPVANNLAKAVMSNDSLRKGTIDVARRIHSFNVWVTYYGTGKKAFVGEMSDARAVDLASTMVTETVIYGVAAGTLYFEWQKSAQASEAKKLAEKQSRAAWEDAAERQRQLLTEQNAKQFEIIFEVRDRMTALEQQVQAVQQGRRRGFLGLSRQPPQDLSHDLPETAKLDDLHGSRG